MTPVFQWLFESLDERLRLRKPGRKAVNHVFPSHWSFLLGELALFSFVVLVATGVFLTMFYRASVEPVVYEGGLALYQGRTVPEAYASILRLSHDVPGGLLFRRIHLGAAFAFVGVAVVHLLRVLLTGAFRSPREVNYHVGVGLLVLAMAAAYTGQNLRYDVMAGTSLRIGYAFLETIPLVGHRVAYWVFGGPFGSPDLLPRFFVMHVLLFPALIAGAVTAHVLMVVRQGHTQFPRPDVDGQRFVAGKPMWPHQFVSSTSLLLFFGGTLAVFAVLVPWADVTLHGPFRPGQASNASQPDFWLMWVEGALRLIPPLEWHVAGITIHQVFVSGVVLPVAVVAALVAYPFLDKRIAPLDGHTHVLQRPTDVPARTAIVLAGTAFIGILTVAAGQDVIARVLRVPVETVIWTLRVALLAVPLAVAALVWWWPPRLRREGRL